MSEYPDATKLINATRARAFAPRKVQTVSEFADTEIRLSKKGSAEPGPWHTDRNPPLREPMDCMSARSTVKEIVLCWPIQFGKALSLDTPIPTPDGWTIMGDLKVGDDVFGADGKPTKVIFTSEIFYNHDCYELTFSDREKITCDAGHLWSVIDTKLRNEDRKELLRRENRQGVPHKRKAVSSSSTDHICIKTTEELFHSFLLRGKQSRYAIPVAGALDLPETDLLIDPYTLGCWLGDGTASGNGLALNDLDAKFITDRIKNAGYHCVLKKSKSDVIRGSANTTVSIDPKGARDGICPRGHILAETGIYNGTNKGKPVEICAECSRQSALKHKWGKPVDPLTHLSLGMRLRALSLIKNKHIPPVYLRASRPQRLALLQGLLDTDGHAMERGFVEIGSSFPALADGIIELIRTLGFKPAFKIKKTYARDSTRITFAAYAGDNVFSLPRKAQSLPNPGPRAEDIAGTRFIVNIEPIASVPTRCIAVDNSDHLFLCGRGFISTHNLSLIHI